MNIIEYAEKFAAKHSDGHFTIMKFTTNWRVSFSTPNDREEIAEMAVAPTLEEAVRIAVARIACSLGRDHWWVEEGEDAVCQICFKTYAEHLKDEEIERFVNSPRPPHTETP